MKTLEIYEGLRKFQDGKVPIEIAEAIEQGVVFYEKMVKRDEFKELNFLSFEFE